MGGNVGGIMNDPTTAMGLQMGQSVLKGGQEYVEQNVRCFLTPNSSHHHTP